MSSTVIQEPTPAQVAGGAEGDAEFFPVRVARKEQVAQGIYLMELRHPEGGELPACTAGSHITVAVPNGSRRNYSLCSDPARSDAWEIAIKRDAAGRGGSISMADDVQPGQLLQVTAPRNNFELSPRARSFLFIAGGIGTTPILSMMRHLQGSGVTRFKLLYLARDLECTAFARELQEEFAGKVTVHHDFGDRARAIDLWPLLESPSGAHIYCCGPQGLMEAVKDMSGHWPSGTVHFESFGVDARLEASNQPFQVRLASGAVFEVGAHESILEALRERGIRVSSSCESGTCGSCRVGLLEGEAEHRDMVLSEEEQCANIMVCVSRAKTPELLLDL